MKLFMMFAILLTTSLVEGKKRYLDYSLQELKITNEKLSEISLQSRKVDDFVLRWGYFFGYCIEEIQWITHELSDHHHMVHSDHSGHWIIDTEWVTHLETFNGYLDYVIDSTKMDSMV